MSRATFTTPLLTINSRLVVLLPQSVSAEFSSRGMVLVKGTINTYEFQVVLEPDGRGSHWFEVDKAMQRQIEANAGDTVTLAVEQSDEWPEPLVPTDLQEALEADKEAHQLWMAITPMARWDWLRWIRATAKQETRAHHIEVALSKLKHGERRPCCFNRAMCTDPSMAKSGVLLAPAP